jgi:hypothetical protein
VQRLVAEFLKPIRERWDAERAIISADDLKLYYGASEHVDPLPASPSMGVTWHARVGAVQRELDAARDADALVTATEELLGLIEVLRRNEPRWLRMLRFPDGTLELFRQIGAALEEERISLGTPDIADEDDAEEYEESPPDFDWIARADVLLENIADFAPDLADDLEHVRDELADSDAEWSQYKEQHEIYWRPEPDEDRWRDSYGSHAEEQFSIRDFFSDL